MTNIDALVSKDLASAAAANRDRLRTLDDTLRAVAPAETVAVPRTTTMSDLRMLALADVFAARVARMAAGAAGLVCVGLMLGTVVAWQFNVGHSFHEIFAASPIDLIPRFAIAILGVHILAMASARAAFARAVTEGAANGETMVARLDRWTLALSIIGPFVCVMVLGVALVTIGYAPMFIFACSLDSHCRGVGFDEALYDDRMRDLAIVVPVALLVAGALVARARRGPAAKTPSVLERGRTVAVGCVIMLVTVVVGVRYDDGLWTTDDHGMLQTARTTELRTILTITGAIGLLLTLSALALWRRRRELQRIASASPSS